MNKIHFELIDSTNTYLKDNYQELENLTFVSSDRQTQGRGRNDRKWDSDGNNLLFSLLLKDKKYYEYTNTISILSAYTILQVLEEYGLNDLSIKWPNDVYVDGKKICGILLEAISKNDFECLIVGIGLNVNQIDFDGQYIHEPTSMKKTLNRDIDIEELRDIIYKRLISNLEKLVRGVDYYEDIVKYDYLRNKQVYALINNEKQLVKVIRINKDYSLCVSYNQTEYNINSGEISFHI